MKMDNVLEIKEILGENNMKNEEKKYYKLEFFTILNLWYKIYLLH